ncbi:LPS assembly lipoprotein LptE [Roseomonas elaeocarpi]|uniref:LPS assembly lipoprotein LptE n=1 Tax=Roseomonas elaeocarpi TaxID=907779 RepID=A0ABV6JX23_9PROT
MTRGITRRALLGSTLLGGAGLLSGCGFQPLYATRDGGPPTAELASVRVGLIPDRSGQLLRRALEQRFGSGSGVPGQYELKTTFQTGIEQEGFRRDGVATRSRITATAPWQLYTMSVPPVLVASGTERSFDAWNIPDNQFFAADASADAAQQRLVVVIASDISEKVALALRARNRGTT